MGGALGLRRRPHLFEDLSAETVLRKRDTQLLKSRCYSPAMQQDNLKNLSTSLHVVQGECGMTCLHFPRLRKKVRGVRRRGNFKNLKGLVSNLLVYYGTFVRREGAFKSWREDDDSKCICGSAVAFQTQTGLGASWKRDVQLKHQSLLALAI